MQYDRAAEKPPYVETIGLRTGRDSTVFGPNRIIFVIRELSGDIVYDINYIHHFVNSVYNVHWFDIRRV